MKGEKYHIYLSTKERNEIVASLINLKNKLIEQGRYTDAVDDVLFKVLKTKRKLKLNMCKRHLTKKYLLEDRHICKHLCILNSTLSIN